MDLHLLAQGTLIFYATNALLALLVIDPDSDEFRQVLDRCSALRPEVVLIVILHVMLPTLLAALLHPRFWTSLARRARLQARRLRVEVSIRIALRRLPREHRAEARRMIDAEIARTRAEIAEKRAAERSGA